MKVALFAILLVISLTAIIALPTISIDSEGAITSGAFQWIRAAMYFIPVNTAGNILMITLGLWVLRVIVTVVRTIWDLLPVA